MDNFESYINKQGVFAHEEEVRSKSCLLYTSDAADDLLCVDLGGRRIIKKKTVTKITPSTIQMIKQDI